MVEIIGDFLESSVAPGEESSSIESLALTFSPSSVPLQQRWRNNGLSADFLADYVTTFFPRTEEDPQSHVRQNEIKAAVSYIANELLENAMKYAGEGIDRPISILLRLEPDRMIFHETNSLSRDGAEKFRQFIRDVETEDPGVLYLRRLEDNALAEGNSSSGLGLLTMINDYQASLAWRFVTAPDGVVTVSTQVRLDF